MSITTRRDVLAASVAGVIGWVLVRPAVAAPGDGLATAVAAFADGKTPQPGRVKLDVAPLVENGNTVPVTVTVESPMNNADHVKAIGLFNERNPQRDVATFALGPRSGRATVATRIRLSTSQKLVAVALMNDGSAWSHSVDVIVTLAACVEG